MYKKIQKKSVIDRKEGTELNIYNLRNCKYLGTVRFENCKTSEDIFDVGEEIVIKIIDNILKQDYVEVYNKRFNEGLDLVLLDKTLEPQVRVQYVIDVDDDSELAFINVVEHDALCEFFLNLLQDHCNPCNRLMELLKDREREWNG